MLKQFVENGHTAFHKRFDSWEAAIQAGCEPLLKDKTITQEYVEAVINCVREFGPYIVIAPHIAIPHSTKGAKGVNDTKIAFMKVDEPVSFGGNDANYDARLFFTLAAVDSEKHLENMVKLTEILTNPDIVAELMEANSDDDLLEIHHKYSE